MGQRHQAFLIARVRPHGTPPDHPGNRRCIAALHHQWCYGTLPLRAMRRLVTLISQPDNAAIVRAELRAIQGKFDGTCPFIATLLLSAWTVDLEEDSFYASSGRLLSAYMGCWDGANNDGLSILDVTDPGKPSYCFLSDCEGIPEQQNAPIDARTYLSLYHDEVVPGDDEEGAIEDNAEGNSEDAEEVRQWRGSLRKLIRALDDVPILPVSWLREAWPYEGIRSPPQSYAPLHAPPELSTVSDVSLGAVPNLSDMSLDIAVKQSIDDGDTTQVEKLLWLPGKAARAKAILRALEPFPDSAVHLLSITLQELKETSRVDLTGFRMSGAQVARALSALSDARSVDLSDNAVIVADDVPDIIATAPTVRRILVRTQPSRFKTIEGILHPAFFPLNSEKPDPYPCAFTYVNMLPAYPSCVSIPFFTPAQIVQALTDVIPWQSGPKSQRMLDRDDWPSVGISAFQGGTRLPGQTANERTVMTVPHKSYGLPRGQNPLWAFVCNMPDPDMWSGGPKAPKGWAFVYYTAGSLAGIADGSVENTDPERRFGKVYDLKDFLECMAKEGRPMPSDQAVDKLEKILHMKDEETGEYCCPLMKQEDLSRLE
ncbi:hypothetical protein C8T65DRAFT_629987 [Cerioporus squamosus]|nr:hypothetical protein C8T65DRAFT_629987 [Cerioporus squamosus]